MNFNREIDSIRFCVYVHTSPSGKRYVGITSRNVSERWGLHGQGYRENLHFWNAICLYGWENFKHEILHVGLTLEEASEAETYYISKYNTIDSEYGYNHTTGGNWSTPSDEIREILRQRSLNRGEDVNRRISESLKGHPVSIETKMKISEAKTGKRISYPPISDARKQDLRNQLAEYHRNHDVWNKGKTKYSDERVHQISEKLKGRVTTEHTKQLLRDSWADKVAHGYKAIWVNDGETELLIQDADKEIFLCSGYTLGRLNIKNIYIYKGDVSIKVSKDTLEDYLADGWALGRDGNALANLKASRQKFRWIYKGTVYNSSSDLADYLRHNGYPKIVGSTITEMFRKQSSKSYPELLLDIHREEV